MTEQVVPDSVVRPAPAATDATTDSLPGFVREARPGDLDAIGRVHAATMLASLQAGHEGPLPDGVRAMIAAPVLTTGWESAVLTPPSPAHHVLVATQGQEVVGLAAVAPASEDSVDPRAEGSRTVDLIALGVHPDHQRAGHGSRLLAACADLARGDGAQALIAWTVRGDDSLARLMTTSGLAPTGGHRRLPVGSGVTEVCWAAAL